MRLAFSTNAYLHHSFPEAARRIAAIGYQGLELMADVPHAWPAYLTEETKESIRAAMRTHELEFSNVNAFMMHAIDDPRQKYWHPSWIESDPHYRRIRVEHTKKALQLAKELGAPSVTTEPGGPVPEGQSWSRTLLDFVETLKPVVEYAERVQVPLLIEPEPGLLLETSEQYLEFAEKIDSPMLGLNCDIGHFYCVHEEPSDVIRKLARHIRHVHLEDIAASRVHEHLIPGEGAIDFVRTLTALREIDYQGWLTIELYTCHADPDLAAAQARKVLLKDAETAGIRWT